MQTKKQFMFGALFFSVLFSMILVSSAITFNTPSTAGDTVTGTYSFNITTSLSEALYCNLSTTASSQFNSTLNTTGSQTEFIITYDSTGITDVEDTTLTANCSNSTDSEQTTLVINVDNTDPVCSFTLSIGEDTIDYMDAYGIYPTDASTDTTDLTYAWILYDPSTNSQQTSTSTAPNFAGSDFDEIGEFIVSLIVTDEASLTHACDNKTVMVKGSNDDEISILPGTITTFIQEKRTPMIVISAVVVLFSLVAVSFFVINKSKK